MEAPSGVSYDSLYGRCGVYFEPLPDVRAKNSSVRLRDYLVGAMALFALKYPSLLALDQSRTRDEERNLKKLFGLNRIPSDTSMREVLDEVAPQSLHGLFDQVNGQVAEQGHRKGYQVLDGHLLAFLIGQIQELASKPFITVLKMVKTRRRLWEEFRAVFSYREVNLFKHLLATIDKSHSFSGS
ncbi:MAG: hypothetical protein IPN20_21880 [Haliscomenobacter sp.]|nr:hypothetical protein [Haliscomenobacter sp.]